MARKIDVLVIGNGPAGNNAAQAVRRTAPDLSVLILGEEAHPEYSAPALADYLAGELDLAGVTVNSFADYARRGIQLHLGDGAAAIDPAAKLVTTKSGEQFQYGKLILATGSFAVRLRRMPGTNLPGNFVMRTLDDVDAIAAYPAKQAVVVGSGAIGLEGALALKQRGYEQVTVVEALEWLSMKSFDKPTSDRVTAALHRHGVQVYAGEGVQQVEGDTRVRAVRTAKRTIPCDLVLWGVGMRPQNTLAQQAGIALGELGGIRVDGRMQTSLPDIYACGDCVETTDRLTGKPAMNMFWEPAARSGQVAGTNAAGGQAEFNGSVALFLTYIGDDCPVVAVGRTEQDLQGSDYQLLEDEHHGAYRRVLLQGDRVVGAQLVGTLEGFNLLLDQIQKQAPADLLLPERQEAGRFPALQLGLAVYLQQLQSRNGRGGPATLRK